MYVNIFDHFHRIFKVPNAKEFDLDEKFNWMYSEGNGSLDMYLYFK